MRIKTWIMAVMCAALLSCGDSSQGGDGKAELNVLLEPEDTITGGLKAGMEEEDIRDGWNVNYEKFLTALGPIQLQRANDKKQTETADEVVVADLTQLPNAGLKLWEFGGIASGRWDIRYDLAQAGESSKRHQSASESDFERMTGEGLTYLIRGSLQKGKGVSCPPAKLAKPGGASSSGDQNARNDPCYANPSIEFELAVDAQRTLGPCSVDEMQGFSVPSGGTQTVAITLHGDHLSFNGFPEGDESNVLRLAQWWADCDLDLSGDVSEAELKAIAPADLAEIDERYQLGGSPITPLATMWDYVRAQLITQGHFQGEGECPW